MTTRTVDGLERTVHKTHEWLSELSDEMGTDDKPTAWRVLRAHLQVLRDRLTIDEGAQLAAQLPHLVRGLFYEGFDPGHQIQPIRDRETYLQRFAELACLPEGEAAPALAASTRVLRRHVTEGEMEDVFAQLPKAIRELLDGA